MSDEMTQYNQAHIHQLLDNLDKHHNDLHSAHGDAHSAHTKIVSAWDGPAAQQYQAAFNKYKQAHENVMEVLKSGRKAVEQAHQNITSMDGQVGQMFA